MISYIMQKLGCSSFDGLHGKCYCVTAMGTCDGFKSIVSSMAMVGRRVNIISISKGKGFAGAMKRHGFSGLRASHGVSVSHRSHGSTGQRQDPGKVFAGKKMAGRMGSNRISAISTCVRMHNDIIFVAGSIAGSSGSIVKLSFNE